MGITYSIYWPEFYTSTIINWKPILSENIYKDIIINSLKFLVLNKRAEVNGFIIMNNHIHLIWQVLTGFSPHDVRSSFMKYTAQQIKHRLENEAPDLLAEFKVNKHDRKHQIWKREALNIKLFTPAVFYQKLDYIHENPVGAELCKYAEEYHYSSAKFYHHRIDHFKILTHYNGN